MHRVLVFSRYPFVRTTKENDYTYTHDQTDIKKRGTDRDREKGA